MIISTLPSHSSSSVSRPFWIPFCRIRAFALYHTPDDFFTLSVPSSLCMTTLLGIPFCEIVALAVYNTSHMSTVPSHSTASVSSRLRIPFYEIGALTFHHTLHDFFYRTSAFLSFREQTFAETFPQDSYLRLPPRPEQGCLFQLPLSLELITTHRMTSFTLPPQAYPSWSKPLLIPSCKWVPSPCTTPQMTISTFSLPSFPSVTSSLWIIFVKIGVLPHVPHHG